MNELKGKVVVITGASTPQGIGFAAAKLFAKAGASLLLVADETKELLDHAIMECRALRGGGVVEAALIDLGKPGEPEAMIARAQELFGRVDVLVNNAAARAPHNFGDFSRETFDHVVAVNLAAAFFASQAVVPLMRSQGGGRIIHVASQLGHVTSPKQTLYGLTKAALIHLTKSMAGELCLDNIIVNSISPGPIATQPLFNRPNSNTNASHTEGSSNSDAIKDAPIAWNSDKIDKLPIGRLGTSDEIAEVIFYLASSSPSFLMGQDIVVDGGYLIR